MPLTFRKAGRFEKLVGFARSPFIVTRGSVTLSCATTPHPSCFSKSQRYRETFQKTETNFKPRKMFEPKNRKDEVTQKILHPKKVS